MSYRKGLDMYSNGNSFSNGQSMTHSGTVTREAKYWRLLAQVEQRP